MSRAFAIVVGACLIAASACTKDVPPADFVADHAAWVALPDEDAQKKSATALVDKWQGKTVRWSALAVAALCVKGAARTDDAGGMRCAMNPFPRSGANATEASALGGVFPLYAFDTASNAALKQKCAGLDRCVVDVTATIRELRLDPDEPLALTLDAKTVHGGRVPADADGWARPRLDAGAPARAAPLPRAATLPHEPVVPPANAPVLKLPAAVF